MEAARFFDCFNHIVLNAGKYFHQHFCNDWFYNFTAIAGIVFNPGINGIQQEV